MALRKAPTVQTAFRLTRADLATIDAVGRQLGLSSRSEALRVILKRARDARKKPKRAK